MLTVEYKVVSVEYFMDKMQPYELPILLSKMNLSVKWDFEMTRHLMYIIAQVNSKRKLKLTDIMKFDWDGKKRKAVSVDMEKMEELSKMMNEIKE